MSKKLEHSDGWYHNRISLALIPVAAILGIAAFFIPLEWWQRGLISGIGCLIQIFMSPDMDLEVWSTSELLWFKIPVIGYSLGYFWSWLWYPYAYFMSHRGLSHNPYFGTLTRIVYLIFAIPCCLSFFNILALLWLGLPVTLTSVGLTFTWWFLMIYQNIFILGLLGIGLYVGDLGHIGRDFKGWQI